MVSLIVIDYYSAERTIKFIQDVMQMICCSKPINLIVVDHSKDNQNFNKMYTEIEAINLATKVEAIEASRITNGLRKIENCYLYTLPSMKIILCEAKNNSGFAKGCNLGADISKELFKDEYLIFSNNDILFEEKVDLDIVLSQFAKDPNIGLIGPSVVGLDGKTQSPNKKLSIWQRIIFYYGFYPLNHLLMKYFDFNMTNDLMKNFNGEYCYRVIGAFMIFKTSTFYHINCFDEYTFLYGEELIIAEKLIKANKKTLFYKNMKVIHEEGGSTNKSHNNTNKMKMMFDSQYHYYKQYLNSNWLELKVSKLAFQSYLLMNRIKEVINQHSKKRREVHD
ncbi:MAG: hypothetical protein CVU84_14170 [Firmicutes bacterium HGW-Firmicutes-1]|jgi:GT2 family glycosyltransferase|nr:MAG: hypothetical protein CVU84_14170 [Firmicutes bacterium HGW-Firmicutes-1]